jgi:uncharacterized protein (DUF342 family)
MIMRRSLPVAGLFASLLVLPGCIVVDSDGSGDLSSPGSWAYQACKSELLQEIKRDHPNAHAIELTGPVSDRYESENKSVLVGQGKFPRDGNDYYFDFRCEVNRNTKSVMRVSYDKK